MENKRDLLYGNIKGTEAYSTQPDCGAFCGCACSCGFCIDYNSENVEPPESSKLIKKLMKLKD